MGDTNLARDDFFRGKITDDKDGYIDLKCFLNCNNIKKMGVEKVDVLAETVEKSTQLELNDKKDKVRRVGNKELPEYSKRKREVKAQAKDLKKTESKAEETAEPVVRDE